MVSDTVREEKNKVVGGMLYLVATPIGNLADISDRARKTMSEVDFIAAEDTRNTARLLSHFEISKPLVSYHEHNKRESGEKIIERLQGGESCALVTDAGTPGISDPGADLVALCAERGIAVTSVPGACAGIGALILSALPTSRFVFEGFLPMQKKERAGRLDDLRYEERTVILHEAPHRLRSTLSELEGALGGERRIALCRELTKLNEEVTRCTLSESVALYSEREPRGEYVLVIEGSREPRQDRGRAVPDMSAEDTLAYYEGKGMSKKDAMRAAAEAFGMSKNEFYKLILSKNEKT